MPLARTASIGIALVALVACGGRGPRVSSPLTEADAKVFDDTIDRVVSPDVLPEGFVGNYRARLCHRVERSDVIVVARIEAIRSDTTPDGMSTIRLAAHVERQLAGRGIGVIELPLSEASEGYSLVHRSESSFLDRRFVVFVKWVEGDREAVIARFHLSPATEEVLGATERALDGCDDDAEQNSDARDATGAGA